MYWLKKKKKKRELYYVVVIIFERGWFSSWENVEPVEENNRERLNQVCPASERRVYGEAREENLADYWRRHWCCLSIIHNCIACVWTS